MIQCQFEKTDSGRWACSVCGYASKTSGAKAPRKNCLGRRRKSYGLGDWVAWLLSLVGVTKRRAQAVARAVGRETCGCAERQEKLNDLGDKLTGG